VELKARIEALIFASREPLSIERMREILGCSLDAVRTALDALQSDYAERGIRLEEVAGGWRFATHPDCAPDVRALLRASPARLSRAAWETLAIIAYRQPITRAEIEAIRGVRSGSQLIGTLIELGWVRIAGRKQVPGRPLLYATTKKFLQDFGLRSLDELPQARELLDDAQIAALARKQEAGDGR